MIFAKVSTWYGGQDEEQTAKITGMILEMDKNDIMNVVNDDNLLKNKVDEARSVLDTTKDDK